MWHGNQSRKIKSRLNSAQLEYRWNYSDHEKSRRLYQIHPVRDLIKWMSVSVWVYRTDISRHLWVPLTNPRQVMCTHSSAQLPKKVYTILCLPEDKSIKIGNTVFFAIFSVNFPIFRNIYCFFFNKPPTGHVYTVLCSIAQFFVVQFTVCPNINVLI